MNYREWLQTMPMTITADALWTVEAYRLALFTADVGWKDCTALIRDRRTVSLSDQLYRASGSVGANIAEGYSRGSGRDRARFYEYSLGSAREARHWYFEARHVLGEKIVEHRLQLLTHIVRLQLVMIPDQRGVSLHEETVPWRISTANDNITAPQDLESPLDEVPLPS